MQYTLGDLIKDLARAPNQDATVKFDFGYFKPTTFDSWRGVYAELALGYSVYRSDEQHTVATLLAAARECIGKTYTGYKGGEFDMDQDTDLHIDNYGEYSNTEIARTEADDYNFIIHTTHRRSW